MTTYVKIKGIEADDTGAWDIGVVHSSSPGQLLVHWVICDERYTEDPDDLESATEEEYEEARRRAAS